MDTQLSRYHQPEDVETSVLKDAFEKSGLSLAELARRLQWYHPDTQRVKRTLGINPELTRGCHIYRKAVRYDTALRIIRALDADPIDYGL